MYLQIHVLGKEAKHLSERYLHGCWQMYKDRKSIHFLADRCLIKILKIIVGLIDENKVTQKLNMRSFKKLS